MQRFNWQMTSSAVAGVVLAGAVSAMAVTVPASLDAQVNGVSGSGSGSGSAINARYDAATVNEFIVLRFDLSGVDKSSITDAALNLITNRSGSNNTKPQRIWAVNGGVANLNTFAEGASFSETPGLMMPADLSTQGVVDADTTFLGRFQLPADPGEGATIVLNDALLSGSSETRESSLDAFLQGLGASDQAVFLIGGAGASTGQFRIATKEATTTATGALTGSAGALAPTLTYSVPEPASLSLLGLGALAALRRRRS